VSSLETTAAAGLGRDAHRLVGLRRGERVSDEVHHHLRELLAVAAHRGQPVRHLAGDGVQLEGRIHPRDRDRVAHDGPRVGGVQVERHRARLRELVQGAERAEHVLHAGEAERLARTAVDLFERTDSPTFRRLADELVTLLAYEATRDVRVEEVTVRTPVAEAKGTRLAHPKPLVVPILRAGLGMLDGMMRLLPTAEVGFLGMVRNEETLEASTYAERLPDDLSGRQCYVLDPMLATGGTLAAAIRFLVDRGADHITAICLLSAPEGCERVEKDLDGLGVPVTVVTAGMDERLNENGYIVPGLGDAGDRLYGIAD